MTCRTGSGFGRGAFSLIETVLAVLILGSALASVLSMISTSVHQVGQSKMQSAAGGFAAGQMNRFLFEMPFKDVKTTSYTEVIVDGTYFQYKLEVIDVPNDEIRFKYKRLPYHDPRHNLPASTGAEPTVLPLTEETRPVTELDNKFTAGGPILKDMLLTVRWHGPGDDYTDDNALRLMTRKARL